MAAAEVVGDVIKLERYPINLTWYQRLWEFMALTMGEVENAVAHLGGRAIGLHVRQHCGHNCIGTIGTDGQLDQGRPKYFEIFR